MLLLPGEDSALYALVSKPSTDLSRIISLQNNSNNAILLP